jgi:hypothetical protein
VSFDSLLDERDAAREAHEMYCAAVNEEGEWSVAQVARARQLEQAYLLLQERVEAAIEAERAEGM